MNTDRIGGYVIMAVSAAVLLAVLLGIWAGNRGGDS